MGEAECAPCSLRFCSARPGSVQVLWVDEEKEGEPIEREYARLEESCFYTQETYVGHKWRLRDAASGALLAEYAGPAATLTLLPDGGLRVQPGLAAPPLPQASDPRWGTFRARGAACGLPILAFDCVCDEAVDTAEGVLARMLEGAPQHVLAALAAGGAQVAIIGKDQVTTDIPMHRHLKGVPCGDRGGDFDTSTRGLGGNPSCPTTSCGEENLLMLEGDRYRCECILVHEFGHAVMDIGLQGHPLRDEILAAYEAAAASGQYDPACYMMANASEYWAEGTQAWFEATVREDVTSGVNTRERVKARDPRLAALLAAVYGDGAWRYPATAPRAFARPGKRRRDEGAEGAGGPQLAVLVENPLQPMEMGSSDDASAAQPLLARRAGGRGRLASPSRAGGSGARGGRGRLATARRRVRRAVGRALGALFTCLCGMKPP